MRKIIAEITLEDFTISVCGPSVYLPDLAKDVAQRPDLVSIITDDEEYHIPYRTLLNFLLECEEEG